MNRVSFGVDQFCVAVNNYKHLRIGLVTNDVAENSFGFKSRIALINAGFNLIKLFSPEHGLSAKNADGAWVPNQNDELTNLPVISLYGNKLTPTAEDLQDIGAVVFDIPDVGCRFYTYLWTMTHMMQACADNNKKFILLDRPNPINGDLAKVEGPLLDEACASFLGRFSIPIRHSCTLGELANYFVHTNIPNLDLEIVKLKYWNRNDYPNHKNWDFVHTSPAIKDASTALLYPGLGLLEGININEGRGTETDFKIFGSPWINAQILKENLDSLNLPGVAFTEAKYVPNWGMYEGEVCNGLMINITDRDLVSPVALGIEILKELIIGYPEECKERQYHTNANPDGNGHLDKLIGIKNSFEKIKNGTQIKTQIPKDKWEDLMKNYLLY